MPHNMRIDPDTCRDPDLLAAEVRRLQAVIDAMSQSDRPRPIAAPEPDTAPAECSVPPEWLQRPYYVDPPSGWRYGFPRLYDPQNDGDMTEWMIANGYPERLARQGLPCTFTAWTEDVEK